MLVQFGGQTPLNIAGALHDAGAPIIGTPFEAIDLAEDRERFGALMDTLGIRQPAGTTANSREEVLTVAARIGFPVLVRPSYVLGGRGMAIIYDQAGLDAWLEENLDLVGLPLLIDKFLDSAMEVDVDALCDGERVTIGGIMQHIENAGVHSGDSACVLPAWQLGMNDLETIRGNTQRIGLALGVRGLFNIQFAIQDDEVYVLEANPRASRTVPFVSKATGVQLARLAAQISAGKTLAELDFLQEPRVDGFFVKEAVLPFRKFPRRGCAPLARDALHRRGDGSRLQLRPRLHQGADRHRRQPADGGRRRLQRERRGQGRGRHYRARLLAYGFRAGSNGGHGADAGAGRNSGAHNPQGRRG